MKNWKIFFASVSLAFPLGGSGSDLAGPPPAALPSEQRASKRYEEMLDRMQAAVEEIAQLYGNPQFLQVFTNDMDRASELKMRLKSAATRDDIRQEVASLEKKREDLLGDIALKEREAKRLGEKLLRQRTALDALSIAVEKAQKAVEDTSR
jgi:hypothetical protein